MDFNIFIKFFIKLMNRNMNKNVKIIDVTKQIYKSAKQLI